MRGEIPHGAARRSGKTSEYLIWVTMRQRCNNPNHKSFAHYGGRGIKVCDRWQNFPEFLADMGLRPSKRHCIERKDNDGDYEPDNCRWATYSEQARNTRRNRFVTIKGERMLLICAVEKYGGDYKVILNRIILGWSIEKAFGLP